LLIDNSNINKISSKISYAALWKMVEEPK